MSDAREAMTFAREAIRDNLSMYQYKNEPLLLEAFNKLEAAIAQNPADEGEPITREWVYENMTITGYGAKINDCLYLKQSKSGWGVYAFNANSEYPEEEFLVGSVATVGDVRRWLALGIGK